MVESTEASRRTLQTSPSHGGASPITRGTLPGKAPSNLLLDVNENLSDLSARMDILAHHFDTGTKLTTSANASLVHAKTSTSLARGAPLSSPAASSTGTAPTGPTLSMPSSTTERLRAACLDHFGTDTFQSVYSYIREIGVTQFDANPAVRDLLKPIIGETAASHVDLVSMLITAEDIEDAIVLKAESVQRASLDTGAI